MLHQVNVVGSLREHGVEDVEYFAKAGVNALGDLKPRFLKVGFRLLELYHCFLNSGELFRQLKYEHGVLGLMNKQFVCALMLSDHLATESVYQDLVIHVEGRIPIASVDDLGVHEIKCFETHVTEYSPGVILLVIEVADYL